MSSTNAILMEQGLDISHFFDLPKMSVNVSQWAIKNYRRGERIYFKNDQADKVFLIKEGRVKVGVYGNDDKVITKDVYGNNDFFGYISLFDNAPRQDFATALSSCTIYAISNANMQEMMRKNAKVNSMFVGLMGKRLINMEQRLQSLLFDTARTRVVNYLRDLAQSRGIRVGYEILIRDFLPHQEIGNLTCTSRQTVSTIMSELRRKNIIYVNRKQVLIRDMEKLV